MLPGGMCPRRLPPHGSSMGLLFVIAICSPGNGAPAEDVGALRVVVAGVDSRPGNLVVRLYDSADDWLETDGAIQTVVIEPAKRAAVSFEGLKPGAYAVSVVHDENGNQKMDLAFFPVPHIVEGGGVSNDVRPKLGPPRFADAVFEFRPPEQSITITVRY